jgi:hypothetical protein
MPKRDNTELLEDVRIIFRNFAGREGMYNRAGDRNFAVLLDEDTAHRLASEGWNVKLLKPREEGDEPQPYLSVTVKFDGPRPPLVKMLTDDSSTELDEETVDMLDWVDIAQVDLVVRPYEWEVSGKTGIKAYLQSLYVTIIEDPLQRKYKNIDIASVEGPMLERTEMMYKPEDA